LVVVPRGPAADVERVFSADARLAEV
jgi:hypothetical protein